MAGRVLSKSNESKLRDALTAIQTVLQALDGDVAESMRESANLGNWLESRLHLQFTEISDELFGNGLVTREERITLSSAIGGALDAFNSALATQAPWLYERSPWQDAPEPVADMAATEAAIDGGFVPLIEAILRRDGTIPVKLIQPGWGSSGYYAPEVLERDGPAAFAAGTKMYWNHPTLAEEADRPEGDLRSLAAELVSGARWDANGVKGPGLYADAKVFGPFKDAIEEMAPHIGVSIRAAGRAVHGEMEGKKGNIIQQIVSARSVDFVTEPGAGGRIVQMFEAARNNGRVATAPSSSDNGALPTQEDSQMSNDMQAQLTEAQRQITELGAQNARLAEALLLREAREVAADTLASATVPDVTRRRLLEQLSANPPVANGQLDRAVFVERINQAVTSEVAYLSEAAGYGQGRIAAMGTGGASDTSVVDAQKRMEDAFGRLGLSDAGVKTAVNGRRL